MRAALNKGFERWKEPILPDSRQGQLKPMGRDRIAYRITFILSSDFNFAQVFSAVKTGDLRRGKGETSAVLVDASSDFVNHGIFQLI
jgi:hypothetical protein